MKKGIFLSLFILILITFTMSFLVISDDNSNTNGERILSNNKEETTSQKETSDKENAKEKITDAVTEVVEHAKIFIENGNLHITAIGDSLTQGLGDESGGGYLKVIENYLSENAQTDYTIDNFGKVGNRSDQLLERMNQKEITDSIKKADVVFITIGANDIMKITKENILSLSYDDFTVELKAYQDRLTRIFRNIREKNPYAHIYLIGLYNPFEEYFGDIPELERIIDDWNWIGQMVVKAQQGATFVPIKNLFQDKSKQLLSEDNFHPNEMGYQLIGEQVLDYLLKGFGQTEGEE